MAAMFRHMIDLAVDELVDLIHHAEISLENLSNGEKTKVCFGRNTGITEYKYTDKLTSLWGPEQLLELGEFKMNKSSWFTKMSETFSAESYNVSSWNCIHFADECLKQMSDNLKAKWSVDLHHLPNGKAKPIDLFAAITKAK